MDELLERVLDTHGGLKKWWKALGASLQLTVDGPFWAPRGGSRIRRPQIVTFDPRRVNITFTPFLGEDTTAVFDVGTSVAVQLNNARGEVLERREQPESAFPPFQDDVAWDALSLAYFLGTANWSAFVEPFLFTYPGVAAHEIEPCREDGQTWRRLAVTFPAYYPTHSREQVFFYDSHMLLRRVDYAPAVLGNTLMAEYSYDPQTYDGFVFYTRREVHFRNDEGITDWSSTPITIGVDSVAVDCR